MLAGVPTVRDAETKVEVKALQEPLLEIMSLDHPEVGNRPIANCELHAERVKG